VVSGIDLAGKIMGLRGQIEDAGAGCIGKGKFGLVGLAVIGLG
jgi:hypothetical protein